MRTPWQPVHLTWIGGEKIKKPLLHGSSFIRFLQLLWRHDPMNSYWNQVFWTELWPDLCPLLSGRDLISVSCTSVWVLQINKQEQNRRRWLDLGEGRSNRVSYLCGYHDYLQNLQAQLPWDLASGLVFLTGAHEVELQVFPQTLFLHLRIGRRHRASAAEDSC